MTDKQRRAAELYEKGLSCREVAKEMGCSQAAVGYLLKRGGVKAREKGNSKKWDARKEEIEYLYRVQDMSQRQIAEYFGVTQVQVHTVMKRLKIEIMSKGRRRGKDHYHFKDGKSSVLYRKVITKDKCRRCGATEELSIHHKNDDHYDNRLENLEVLCNPCHMSETKKKWWAAKKAGLPTPKSNGKVGWSDRKPASP